MYKKFVLLALPLLYAMLSPAQDKPLINSTVSGTVVDARTKEPLPGASIKIEGVTNQTVTDDKGNFRLVTGQKLPYHVIVRFIGYDTLRVELTTSPARIELTQTLNQLDGVVVVGYGTQKKSDVTGSIASVPPAVKEQPVNSIERLLQGSVAGVVVTQTNGQPGGGVSVQIRGNNSISAGSDPLYVIDGFPINNNYSVTNSGVTNGPNINPLSTLNTADIESIDVLKDASATAIYGSRGANGVVLITTRKGSKNKSSINYDGYYGVQKVIKTIPLLNAREWWALRKDAATNSGKSVTLPTVTGYSLDTSGEGTDWQAAAFTTAPMQSHSLSIFSGSEKTRLAIAGNYLKQEGVIIKTGFERFSARLNVEHDYNTKLKITSSIIGTHTKANVAPANIVQGLLYTPPSLPIYQDDGTYVKNSPFETVYANPINTLNNQTNETITNRFLGNVAGEYTIADGLKAKVLLGADVIDNKQNRYLPKSTYEGSSYNGYAAVGSLFTSNWLNENTITYDRQFNDKHRISTVAGFTAQQSQSKGVTAVSYGYTSDNLTYNDLGSGTSAGTPGSSALKWSLASYLARVNYAFDDRFLVTFSFRADGSSKFSAGNKWGYFPSGAIGWNIYKERFFENVKGINVLKLRLSAGSTGNQDIDAYQSLARIAYYPYNFSGTAVSGYAPKTVSNKNLTWEKTFQVNAGLDIGLLNGRISIVTDYYYKKTTNLLLTGTVPGTSGLADLSNNQTSTTYQNIGAISNKGFELNINSNNLTGEFRWNTILNFSRNTNKILQLTEGVEEYIPSSAAPSIAKIGHPVGSFIVYKTDGIIQEGETALTPQADTGPGGQQYKDINGDGKITSAGDRIVIDNQLKFTGGLTNSFSYKGFDLSIFFQASVGGKLYNTNEAQLELGTGYTNASRVMLRRWTPTNTNTDVKEAYQDPAITISDRFIEDATYYRLKNVSLSYSFPRSFLTAAKLKGLRLYISAQNLVTWTNYTGFDPEVSSNGQSLINKGVDNNSYPNNKSYQAGLTLTL
ncbi:TonB-dependent receptor [Chitinophaga sp.]|uniref:SusC/RagA family TonB-linked outer membrane protein n=1 Tax=Chitinophaga sp. TaxID=1869181 RepID=UPI0031D2A250